MLVSSGGQVTLNIKDHTGKEIEGYAPVIFPGKTGSDVTLTAPTVEGYDFIGFYTTTHKLLSKNSTYVVPGTVFTKDIVITAIYESDEIVDYLGILSYTHSTYNIKSENGTVSETPAPLIKTENGYTNNPQYTGVVTKNGVNDYTVYYADVDSSIQDIKTTLSAQTSPNNSAYQFTGWLDNGVSVVTGGSTTTLAFSFGDTSKGATPSDEKTIIAVWVDALYDIKLTYKYKTYNGNLVTEVNYDLSGKGSSATDIVREVKGVGLSTFLANIEQFATQYAPIVNDVRYDYVFKYDSHTLPTGNDKEITYNAVADYTQTTQQRYTITKGTGSKNFTVTYNPEAGTDSTLYNWIVNLVAEKPEVGEQAKDENGEVVQDDKIVYVWYTKSTTGNEILYGSYDQYFNLRATSTNNQTIYLICGKASETFEGKRLDSYITQETTIHGNEITYTNVDNVTNFHYRTDVNLKKGDEIEKMGAFFYYAKDSVNTGSAEKELPDGYDINMESGEYAVPADLSAYVDYVVKKSTATQKGETWFGWIPGAGGSDAYLYAADLTYVANKDNQVSVVIPLNNNTGLDYYANVVFVSYVKYTTTEIDADGTEKRVTKYLFSDKFAGTIPTEYYNVPESTTQS